MSYPVSLEDQKATIDCFNEWYAGLKPGTYIKSQFRSSFKAALKAAGLDTRNIAIEILAKGAGAREVITHGMRCYAKE